MDCRISYGVRRDIFPQISKRIFCEIPEDLGRHLRITHADHNGRPREGPQEAQSKESSRPPSEASPWPHIPPAFTPTDLILTLYSNTVSPPSVGGPVVGYRWRTKFCTSLASPSSWGLFPKQLVQLGFSTP